MTVSQAEIDIAVRLIKEADRIAAFTGAGISTESGLAGFRSPGDLCSAYGLSGRGYKMIFLNHTPTQYDELADLIVRDSATAFLARTLESLEREG